MSPIRIYPVSLIGLGIRIELSKLFPVPVLPVNNSVIIGLLGFLSSWKATARKALCNSYKASACPLTRFLTFAKIPSASKSKFKLIWNLSLKISSITSSVTGLCVTSILATKSSIISRDLRGSAC